MSWEEKHLSKLTGQGRKVLDLAQEESNRFQHSYIGTEHLLLGLTRDEDSLAAQVLASLSVELIKVRRAVEFIIGRGDRVVLGQIFLTPRAKKVIELSIDEANRLGQAQAGPEHILLGLVREGPGIGAGVLESFGVNLQQVRERILALIQKNDEDQSSST